MSPLDSNENYSSIAEKNPEYGTLIYIFFNQEYVGGFIYIYIYMISFWVGHTEILFTK